MEPSQPFHFRPNKPYRQGPSQKKPVCNNYVQSGFCKFAKNCKFYHPKSVAQNFDSQA